MLTWKTEKQMDYTQHNLKGRLCGRTGSFCLLTVFCISGSGFHLLTYCQTLCYFVVPDRLVSD
jgi:hypothetical protein